MEGHLPGRQYLRVRAPDGRVLVYWIFVCVIFTDPPLPGGARLKYCKSSG